MDINDTWTYTYFRMNEVDSLASHGTKAEMFAKKISMYGLRIR